MNLSLSTFTLVRSKDRACKTYREACKPNWWQCVWPICHWDSHPHHCIYNSYVGSHSFLFGAIGVGPSEILCLRKRAQFPIEYKIGDHVDCWEDSYKFPGVENIVIVINVVIIRKQNKICWEHLGSPSSTHSALQQLITFLTELGTEMNTSHPFLHAFHTWACTKPAHWERPSNTNIYVQTLQPLLRTHSYFQ